MYVDKIIIMTTLCLYFSVAYRTQIVGGVVMRVPIKVCEGGVVWRLIYILPIVFDIDTLIDSDKYEWAPH